MTRFRFVVHDPKKSRHRRGYIKAKSLQAATDQLLAKGFEIQLLEPADASKIEIKSSKKSIPREALDPKEFRPSLLRSLSNSWPSREAVTWWLLVGTILSVIVFALNMQGSGSSSARVRSASQYKNVVITFKGNLGATLTSQESVLTLALPEIPYTRSWQAEQPEDPLEFQSKRVPTYAVLSLKKEGEIVKHRKVTLSNPPTIDLGQVF
jgi:hypothetical protein